MIISPFNIWQTLFFQNTLQIWALVLFGIMAVGVCSWKKARKAIIAVSIITTLTVFIAVGIGVYQLSVAPHCEACGCLLPAKWPYASCEACKKTDMTHMWNTSNEIRNSRTLKGPNEQTTTHPPLSRQQ